MIETAIGAIADPRKRLLAFAVEREAIRLRRAAGQAKPWTMDPILRAYRFCDVRREDDAVTQWIRVNWREPHAGDADLWFGMVVARLINWPATLQEIGWPVPWPATAAHFLQVMAKRRAAGEVAFGPAYIVSTNGVKMEKAQYLCSEVLAPLWMHRNTTRPRAGDSLNSYHITLGAFRGLGSFMAAQVIADLKYCEPLRQATDWHTFAASGPGSRRGLSRVLNRPVDTSWNEDRWRQELRRLQDWLNERWPHEALHGQDCQNVLCEFDKMERVRLGEGRPKRLYNGET